MNCQFIIQTTSTALLLLDQGYQTRYWSGGTAGGTKKQERVLS